MRSPRVLLSFIVVALFQIVFATRAMADADLSVTWEAIQQTADPGDRVHYLARIHNLGPEIARGVNLSISVPLDFTPVVTDNWNCAPFSCFIRLGDLAPSRSPLPVSFAMDIPLGYVGGSIVSSGAVGSMDRDPNPSNNRQLATVVVSTVTDLRLELIAPHQVHAGDDVTVVLSILNTGDRVAPAVVLRSHLPPHAAFVPEKSDDRWSLSRCGVLQLDAGDTPQDGGPFDVRLTLRVLPTHLQSTLSVTASAVFVGTDTNPTDNTGMAQIWIEPSQLDAIVHDFGDRIKPERVQRSGG